MNTKLPASACPTNQSAVTQPERISYQILSVCVKARSYSAKTMVYTKVSKSSEIGIPDQAQRHDTGVLKDGRASLCQPTPAGAAGAADDSPG